MQIAIGTKQYINSFISKFGFETDVNHFGKPLITNKKLYFNKSHTNDLSVVIIDNKLCGIDIENIRKYNELMAKKICSDDEYKYLKKSNNKDYNFTLLWVLKESYLKCIGVGLSHPLKEIDFINNNTLEMKKNGFSLKVINYKNHIISICRKD